MIKEPIKEELQRESRICKVEKYERGDDKNYTVYFDNGVKALFDEEEFYKYDIFDTENSMKDPMCDFVYAVNERRCFLAGVSILSTSLKPSGFVEKNLRDSGFDQDQIEIAVKQLAEEKYLDDERFAFKYIGRKSDAGNTSSKMIEMELISKGIPEDTARRCVRDADINDFKTALKIVKKKRSAGDENAKIMRYLSSKGFESSVIIKAVNGNNE